MARCARPAGLTGECRQCQRIAGECRRPNHERSACGFGMDDSDFRWAHPWSFGPDQLLITGVEVNNTPTEPDIYNTVPDWSAPFSSSKYSAIRQIPTTFIEGAHGAGYPLVGVGTYEAYIFGPNKANWLYFEADGYTNADGIGVQANSGGGIRICQ